MCRDGAWRTGVRTRLGRERPSDPTRFSFSTRGMGDRPVDGRAAGEMQEDRMGYERNDHRYGYNGPRGPGADREQSYGFEQGRDRAQRDYGSYGGSGARDYRGDRFNDRSERSARTAPGYDDDERGFFDRAGDEVRSWFGDEEAERRRRLDERQERASGPTRDWAQRATGQGSSGESGYRSRHEHDPHYRAWRDRQLESLDRDYDEYRREHQTRFDSEFGSWRTTRQGQRQLLARVEEHQEVIGSDGAHIGTIDHIRGDRILLTKTDQAAGGHHHSIPSSWIQSVEDGKVTVTKTADQAKQHWRDEDRNRSGGLFDGDGDRAARWDRTYSGL
jgi:hypothetical protein